jgi:hypothetical protein
MSYTIISAKYANPDNTAVICTTQEAGDTLLSLQDTNNAELATAFATWGGAVSAFVQTDAYEICTAKRQRAYEKESDPLFFQEQRGDVPGGTWAAKVAEIKARFPR